MNDSAVAPTDPTAEFRLSRLEADSRQLQEEMRGMRDELGRLRETLLERFALSDATTAAGFAAAEQVTAARFAAAEQDAAAKFADAALDTAAKFAVARQETDAKFASLETALARASGQVSQLPTTWTITVTFIAAVGIITLGFAIARLLGRG